MRLTPMMVARQVYNAVSELQEANRQNGKNVRKTLPKIQEKQWEKLFKGESIEIQSSVASPKPPKVVQLDISRNSSDVLEIENWLHQLEREASLDPLSKRTKLSQLEGLFNPKIFTTENRLKLIKDKMRLLERNKAPSDEEKSEKLLALEQITTIITGEKINEADMERVMHKYESTEKRINNLSEFIRRVSNGELVSTLEKVDYKHLTFLVLHDCLIDKIKISEDFRMDEFLSALICAFDKVNKPDNE